MEFMIKELNNCAQCSYSSEQDPSIKATITDIFHPDKDKLPFTSGLVHFAIAPYSRTAYCKLNSTYSLIFVTQGTGIVELDKKRHVLKKGTIFFIPAKTKKRFINESNETLELVALEEPAFQIEDAEPQEKISITPKQ